MNTPLSQSGYAELRRRLCSGQAVFFFGAGMSIDGEGNTAARLLTRLYLRFMAITACLIREDGTPRQKAEKLRDDLKETFFWGRTDLPGLSGTVNADFRSDDAKACFSSQINLLSERYYDFNDWICAAYQCLLAEFPTDERVCGQLLSSIAREEQCWMNQWAPSDAVALGSICKVFVRLAQQGNDPGHEIGKALFLDTMGFYRAPEIMGGDAKCENVRKLQQSYHGKLQERHWILARFAREGWAPLVLTTNFDRLIEGAFRLSGFRSAGSDDAALPPVPVPVWETVTEAVDFFERAGRKQTALVVKIHGCSEKYERLRQKAEENGLEKDWRNYLRAMVFTFREIQNWREDTWSRDFLRTLLRTRAMVFCGYSARDPVIHDTLRSVYEEMTRRRLTSRDELPSESNESNESNESENLIRAEKYAKLAPAFFLAGGSSNRDFHGIEVLRAASAAATGLGLGLDRSQEHPNYLRHGFRARPGQTESLPDTDDVFLWTYHSAYREQQREYLRQEIRGLAGLLLSRRIDEEAILRITEDFSRLVVSEESEACELGPDQEGHRALRRLTRWTYHFHPRLLREFACAEAGRMGRQWRSWLVEMRKLDQYYFPLAARPAWAAWGAVVELALRNVAEAVGFSCEAGVSRRPAVLFSPQNQEGRLPRELMIRHVGMEKPTAPARAKGATLVQTIWEIGAQDHPWPSVSNLGGSTDQVKPASFERPFHRARGKAPDASLIWQWASRNLEDIGEVADWCGLEPLGGKN